MAQKMVVVSLNRLTLVRKSRATAKHPDTRIGAVEAIKADDRPLLEQKEAARLDPKDIRAKVEELLALLKPGAPAADGGAPEAEPTPESDPAPVEPPAEGADKESARPMKGHSHSHTHATTYGYTYSHEHQHGDAAHADADDHSTSETAHAHQHVEKADDGSWDALKADNEGLKQDLDDAKKALEELEALRAQVTELTEKLSAMETAKAEVEKAKETVEAQKAEAEAQAARKPLTAAPQAADVHKSVATITPETKFDDAFDIAMGRARALPRF